MERMGAASIGEPDLLECLFRDGLNVGPDEPDYRDRLIAELDAPKWGERNGWISFVPPSLQNRWSGLSRREKIVAYLVARVAQYASSLVAD
jgi:hypothetical protein